MNILVTGGAGYIGSHTAKLLHENGHEVWLYDNLSTGHKEAVIPGRWFIGDLCDSDLLHYILKSKEIEVVMHFAGSALVGESVTYPAKYYQNNVVGSLLLLEAMRVCGVRKLIFSSTGSVYGDLTCGDSEKISETCTTKPKNTYAHTKLFVEKAIENYAIAYGFEHIIFRYFNAAGASADGTLGEDHTPETHLIPRILNVASNGGHIDIYGIGHGTKDGTCVRDYIHVEDIASAHLAALDIFGLQTFVTMNLGCGFGHSVSEIVDACGDVTGKRIETHIKKSRTGDPQCLIADPSLAMSVLDWAPKYTTLESIIESAWEWYQANPNGYAGKSKETPHNNPTPTG